MLNTESFIKRLEIILDYYGLSASSFADKIGVQRSSLSHLLSGRNKPSLDFILKIVEVFPDIDLYWILNGFGNFPKSEKEVIAPTPIYENKIEVETQIPAENLFNQKNEEVEENETKNPIVENSINKIENSLVQNIKFSANEEKIEKIVFFYANGKFSEFSPK